MTDISDDQVNDLVDAWEQWFLSSGTNTGPWHENKIDIVKTWKSNRGHWAYCLRGWDTKGSLPSIPEQDVVDAATARILARIKRGGTSDASADVDTNTVNATPTQDAWKQLQELRDRYTDEHEVRPDLVVTALGLDRKVRLRVGEWSFNKMKADPRDHTPEPQITTRNVKTMRELAAAINAACDFVEEVNPIWASLSSPSIEPFVVLVSSTGGISRRYYGQDPE